MTILKLTAFTVKDYCWLKRKNIYFHFSCSQLQFVPRLCLSFEWRVYRYRKLKNSSELWYKGTIKTGKSLIYFQCFFHLSFQFTEHLKLWLRWCWGREWWGCYKAIHFLSATHLWLDSQRGTMAKSVAPLPGFTLRPKRDMSSLRGERMSSVQQNILGAISALKHTRKRVKHLRKPVHLIKQLELCWYLKQHPQYTFTHSDKRSYIIRTF